MSELEDFFRTQVERFSTALYEQLPSIAAAIVILLVGWLLAKLVKTLVLKLGAAFGHISSRAGISRGLRHSNFPWPISVVLANVAFWSLILVFLNLATEVLEVPAVAAWLNALLSYLPDVLASAAIILLGYLAGVFCREAIGSAGAAAGIPNARLLGQIIFFAVVIVTLIVAAGQLGVDVTLLAIIIAVAAAALFGAMGLAFGLGAWAAVGNIIAVHYLKRLYRTGQRIRVDGIDGEILEITPTAVILDTRQGRAVVPGRVFNEATSLLLDAESTADDD